MTHDNTIPTVAVLLASLLPAACAALPQPAPRSDAHPYALSSTLAPPANAVGFPEFPALSPDGSVICFSWSGDLWLVHAAGGPAQRLTAHPADESRSAFSPDGSLLAFESDRDGAQSLYLLDLLWPAATPNNPAPLPIAGPARRLTFADRPQTLSSFSHDGTSLYFHASYEPSLFRQPRMYAAPVNGGPVTRLTDAFGREPIPSPDGSIIAFSRGYSAYNRPIYRGPGNNDIHLLHTATNTFTTLTSFNANDGFPQPLPGGQVLFVSSRDGQNNLFSLPAASPDNANPTPPQLKQLTFFKPAADQPTIGHGVRDLAVNHAGTTAAFVVWDTLYTLDLSPLSNPAHAGPLPAPRPVALYAPADSARLDTDTLNISTQVREAALSPDGNTVAVITRGELFIRATEEGQPTRRVTDTVAREADPAWSPDGVKVYFSSDRSGTYGLYVATVALTREDINPKPEKEDKEEPPAKDDAADPGKPADAGAGDSKPAPDEPGAADAPDDDKTDDDKEKKDAKPKKPDPGKRWADALRFTVETLIDTDADERLPVPSPDGKHLLYTRGLGDLILRNLASGDERSLLRSFTPTEAVWAADSRHVIYEVQDFDFNSDIWLLDALDPAASPVNLTQHPDLDHSPRLSHDGKVLYFLSDRDGENFDFAVYRVHLDKKLDSLQPYELDAYYKDAAKAAKGRKPLPLPDDAPNAKPAPEPTPLVFDAADAFLRVARVTRDASSNSNLAVTPAADRVIFSASADGSANLYSIDHKGADRKTVTTGGVSGVSVSLTGDKVLYIKSGQAATSPPAGGKTDALAIDAQILVNVAQQQRHKFLEAARIIGTQFYHPTLKGLDWPAITGAYASLAEQTRTTASFNRVANMLFGELDGSHTGISGGPQYSPPPHNTGYLGIDTTPTPNGHRVTYVVPQSPADSKESPLRVGDEITAVNDTTLLRPDGVVIDLAAALLNTAGKETLLTVARQEAPAPVHILTVPISYGRLDALRYEDNTLARRKLTESLSNNRIGYLHIRGMSERYVRDFERDLFAAAHGKDALIIDVRDNGGGSTADILLSSLTAPNHARTVPRGADPAAIPVDAYPRDRRLIYGYTRPIAVLCNENSFSNAEIFSHAIKTTGRGTVVGQQTFGGVISTGAASLIDGASVRTPFRGWYLPDGTDMENNGCIPDILVPHTPADDAAGADPQLQAAVNHLLSTLPPRGP